MPKHIWSQERINAKKQEREAEGFIAIGSDIDPAMQELVLENAERAGVPELVKFSAADFSELKLPERRSLVVCNPPYGERLADTELAKQQTRTMGKLFVPSEHTAYHIISSLEDFEKLFGRQATKRRKLYNGNLRCTLYSYDRAVKQS